MTAVKLRLRRVNIAKSNLNGKVMGGMRFQESYESALFLAGSCSNFLYFFWNLSQWSIQDQNVLKLVNI